MYDCGCYYIPCCQEVYLTSTLGSSLATTGLSPLSCRSGCHWVLTTNTVAKDELQWLNLLNAQL